MPSFDGMPCCWHGQYAITSEGPLYEFASISALMAWRGSAPIDTDAT